MYFHILIEATDVGGTKKTREIIEKDKTELEDLEKRILIPYLTGQTFRVNGYSLDKTKVHRILVKQSSDPTSTIVANYQARLAGRMIVSNFGPNSAVRSENYTTNITDKVFDKLEIELKSKPSTSTPTFYRQKVETEPTQNKRVFIVHGRDDNLKTEVARFIEKIGLHPIILHEQANEGKTIIEKIEKHTEVGFGIVLYTPCDVGGLNAESLQSRARQNVVFEHGLLIGKLGRSNVCALKKGDVEEPTDISGIVYTPYDQAGAWKFSIAKELKNAGCLIDMNLI